MRAPLGRRALDAPGTTRWGATILAIFDAAKTVLAVGAVFEGTRGNSRIGHEHIHSRVALVLNGLDLGDGGRLVVDRGQIGEACVTDLPAAIGRVEFVDERLIICAQFAEFGQTTRGHMAQQLVGGKGGRRGHDFWFEGNQDGNASAWPLN